MADTKNRGPYSTEQEAWDAAHALKAQMHSDQWQPKVWKGPIGYYYHAIYRTKHGRTVVMEGVPGDRYWCHLATAAFGREPVCSVLQEAGPLRDDPNDAYDEFLHRIAKAVLDLGEFLDIFDPVPERAARLQRREDRIRAEAEAEGPEW